MNQPDQRLVNIRIAVLRLAQIGERRGTWLGRSDGRPLDEGALKMACTIYDEICHEHEFQHGAEAEELRERIEKYMETLPHRGRNEKIQRTTVVNDLRKILDDVDARDSVAYLERKKRS